jgi:hypothetical protein
MATDTVYPTREPRPTGQVHRLAEPIVPTVAGNAVVLSPSHRVQLSVVELDSEQAAIWLVRYHYERQRPEYPSVVRHYATMMRAREWGISTIMLCTYTPDGATQAETIGPAPSGTVEDLPPGTYIINGRNRLNAVIESGSRPTFLVEHHLVSTPGEVHSLYMTQDRGRTRQAQDVYRAIGLPEELDLSLWDLRMIGEAESYVMTSFGARIQNITVDPYRRADFIRDWAPEGRDWKSCVEGSRSYLKHYLTASPITAVALVILRFQPEQATRFLTAFAHDDGLRQGTPEKTLHDWVIENRVRSMPAHHYSRHVAAAWNAAFEERDLERLLIRDADRPIRILGTPYTGRQPLGAPLPDTALARPGQEAP